MAAEQDGQTAVSRRRFLAAGSLGVVGLSMGTGNGRAQPRRVIQIVQTGGASQLETFDPKPSARREIRGPLRAISTQIPGVAFSEGFPRLAERSDSLLVIRSLTHDKAPVHEVGLQQLLCGRTVQGGVRPPSLVSIVQYLHQTEGTCPAAIQLGGALSGTGLEAFRGTGAGGLEDALKAHGPISTDVAERFDFNAADAQVRETYGKTREGQLLWQAARAVEAGVRLVTVFTHAHLAGERTWDAHAHATAAPATVYDYRDTIGPRFDRAAAALLDDLRERGLDRETLVVCSGEMGRTPRLSDRGGRDHWPHAWSGFLAGGGLAGGGVLGATDDQGMSVVDDPVALPRLAATILDFLGIDPHASLDVGTEEPLGPLVPHQPPLALA